MSQTQTLSLPLDYANIKRLHGSRRGMNLNPFFGKWNRLDSFPEDIMQYRYAINTRNQSIFHHPMVTKDHLTAPASYYLQGDTELPFLIVRESLKALSDSVFIHADTVDGPYLIVTDEALAADLVALGATVYKLYASKTIAKATRPVEASDRHIHWLWFRKPGYRLTEEIVLRAASWIEQNPGYTFHLWSSLKDAAEKAEFLENISEEARQRYFDSGAITVHYDDEFRNVVFQWISEHTPHLTDTFATVWNSRERQDTVMKTDYTRNIILAIYGGIYTDFNDLLCLAPIEPFLEAHAGSFVGCTDNTSPQNASNYFMYAAAGNPDWLDITKRCFDTLPLVRGTIYSEDALQAARDTVTAFANGQFPSSKKGEELLTAGFNSNMPAKFYHYAIGFCLMHALPESSPALQPIRELMFRSTHGRVKPSFTTELISHCRTIQDELLSLIPTDHFAAMWRFAHTDIYLNPIMHRTNLPIFCREQNIPIYLAPFGYLLRYGCLLSFVGHLGDATSYGMAPQQKTTIRYLVGEGYNG